MKRSPYHVPAAIGTLLSHLPVYPGSVLLTQALNLALARRLPDDVWQMLKHKKLQLKILDARLTFDFTVKNGAFAARTHDSTETDLTIAANAYDFLQLAQRQEDPDTLFFSRRLVMEGDTELGLLVKNALDALDFPVFDFSCLLPRNWSKGWHPDTTKQDITN